MYRSWPNNGEILDPSSACCLLELCRRKVLWDHFLPLMPVRYRVMQSWTLHDVHDTRSAVAVINASTSSTTLSLMSGVMPRTLCLR